MITCSDRWACFSVVIGVGPDDPKRLLSLPSKKAHSEASGMSISPPRSAPPNPDWSSSHWPVSEQAHSRTVVRVDTENGQHFPGLAAAGTAHVRDLHHTLAVDVIPKSPGARAPITDDQAPEPSTTFQQQGMVAATLVNTTGVAPQQHEMKTENRANDINTVKRPQQISVDADPTQSYRNLVKIGQG